MSDLTFLTDAPQLSGSGPTTSWIQIAKTGRFKHPLFGNFKVDASTFDSFEHNLTVVSGGRVAIDFDHAPDKGGPTKARGWITDLERREGETQLWARVEWTGEGARAIREREYLFISPTWKLKYQSDDGTERGPTLLGAALTNRPWFERMAVVNLTQTFSRPPDGAEFAWDAGAHPRGAGGRFVTADSKGAEAEGAKHKLGELSAEAIKRYQKKHGLHVDGVIGHQTTQQMLGKDKADVGELTDADRKALRKLGKHHTHDGVDDDEQTFAMRSTKERCYDSTDAELGVDEQKRADEDTMTLEEFDHVGFDELAKKLEGEGHSPDSARRITAAIGRRKYGAKGMAKAAAEGKPANQIHSATDSDEPSDSRPAMTDFEKIALTFGLPATASEEEIINAAQASQRRNADAVTLAAVAKTLGVEGDADQTTILSRIDALKPAGDYVTLSRDKYEELQNFAQEAQDSRVDREKLAEMTFDTAFSKAMGEGRAAPGTRDDLYSLFQDQPEKTLELIQSLPPVVNTTAIGRSGGKFGQVPDGQDPERWELDQRAQMYMRDHSGTSYLDAVDAVSKQMGVR